MKGRRIIRCRRRIARDAIPTNNRDVGFTQADLGRNLPVRNLRRVIAVTRGLFRTYNRVV
jgi:hypothetical protein